MFAKQYMQSLEAGMRELSEEERARLYMPCAIGCVSSYALPELRRQFEECGDSLDAQYTKYGRTEYFFADIIESGRVYEIGYPRCVCPLVAEGYAKDPAHCECSRQSIFYVYEDLIPGEHVEIETLHTVLGGADECRFRVTVG